MYRVLICGAALVLGASAAGCAGGGADVEYVEGVVMLDGQPVEGVNVSFSPLDTKAGKGAVGITDASGVFKLTAIPDGKPNGGAAAGEYHVVFSKVTANDPNATMTTDDPNYGKSPGVGELSQPIKMERLIPEKYENAATSGFKVTVKAGDNKGDDFKFDLKKE